MSTGTNHGGFSHDSMKFKKQNEGLHDNLTYYY